MCMYIYTYIYISTYEYIYACIHLFPWYAVCVRMCMYVFVCMCIVCWGDCCVTASTRCIHIHIFINLCKFVNIHDYAYTYVCIYVHMKYVYIYIYWHTYRYDLNVYTLRIIFVQIDMYGHGIYHVWRHAIYNVICHVHGCQHHVVSVSYIYQDEFWRENHCSWNLSGCTWEWCWGSLRETRV